MLVFDDFTEKLYYRLKEPLPGEAAQMRMMASSRYGSFNHLQPNAQTKEGGVLILLYPDKDQIFLPLIQRPDFERGAHRGQVSFPGGRKEESDENLTITALREAQEEVGIDINKVEVVGELSPLFVFASNFMVYPTVAITHEKPDFVPNVMEVTEILEASIDHLKNPDNLRITQITIDKGLQLKAPYFDVGGRIVWGATAMMLSEFLAITDF